MEDALGIDAGGLLAQVSLIVWLTLVLFAIVSPVGGYLLYRYVRLRLPMADTFALLAAAFCVFLISFAVLLLALLQSDPPMQAGAALGLSALFGLLVTLATALLVRVMVRRGQTKLEDHRFSVWDEDQRKRGNTYHHKRR